MCEPIAREIQAITGKETRSLVLGHLQRGGMPTGYDRLLATRFGGAAVRAIADEKWGHMVALQSPHIVTIPDRGGACASQSAWTRRTMWC